ncbi:MAG: D-alanyl-D-alanine carboxypeptidase [Ruminiclostridium sp.]|nr:D-alanyl-D-alanine carboxypeptidase [Ruminiclostridium sp.]
MRNIRNLRFTAVFLSILLFVAIIPVGSCNVCSSAAFTPDIDLYSDAYYMVNLDLGTVIAAKNENKKCYPASITKLMTAIVAYENCADLSMPMQVTYDCTNEFWEGDPNKEGAGTCGLAVGQTNLTMKDCLYGLLIRSGCEAGNVIAYNICKGDIPKFIDMMNKKAKDIGCENTHFGNTHGLWQEDNYSTPYDLFLIAKYIYDKLPELVEISNTYEYVMPANDYNPSPYPIYNVNSLINNVGDNPYYYEFANGLKTGSMGEYYTKDASGEWSVYHAGFANVVSTASQNGFNYMLVTCGAPYFDEEGNRLYGHFKDSIALYKWAFRTFDMREVMNENTFVANVKVDMGENADVSILKPSAAFSTLLPKDLDPAVIQQKITITAEKNSNDAVVAPIEKGQVMGTLELILDGETLWTTNLVASQTIELSQFEYTMRMINSIFDKWWFRLCVAALAVLIIADVVLNAVQKARIAKLEARRNRKANIRNKW